MIDRLRRVSRRNPELFHYTTLDAFRNIYKSGKFWATHFEDLNDYSELGRFRIKVRDFIAPLIRNKFQQRIQYDNHFATNIFGDGGIEKIVAQQAETQCDVLHRVTFGDRGLPDTFICSFCTHKAGSAEASSGLLSQWRAYGAGGGVAIVLDTLGIEERMEYERDVFSHPVNHIGDVVYDTDDEGIMRDFSEAFRILPSYLKSIYCDGIQISKNETEDLLIPFVHGSTLVKHHGFHEENEVRIVVCPVPTNPDSIFYSSPDSVFSSNTKKSKKIKYREKDQRELRYIELFGDRPLPIKRVIIGPSRLQNVYYQNLTECVAGSKLEIVKSKIPYLG